MIKCKITPVTKYYLDHYCKGLMDIEDYVGNLSSDNLSEATIKVRKIKLLNIISRLLDNPDTYLEIKTPDIRLVIELNN